MLRRNPGLAVLCVLTAAALVAGLIAGGVMLRKTHPTALGLWLGPEGIADLAPGYLTFRSDLIMNSPEGATREGLRDEAYQETAVANLIRSRGTPPNHQGDVAALIDGLYHFASTQFGASLCPTNCLVGFAAVNAEGVTLARTVEKVYLPARPSRHRPWFHKP